ncbi:MAG: peptidoglycan DD-metalloendopeptidase family protein [Burkholderiales bacterium]|nr:peptidoglycan DD-metalloendopeptidase family protein [Burkholderiales bacterium]
MRNLTKISSSILASFLSLGLILSIFFAPLSANAGLFSSILGTEASAVVINPLNSTQTVKNSQNMSLLEADMSSLPISKDDEDKAKEGEIKENVDVNIVSDNALLPVTGPLGVSDGTEDRDSSFDQVSVYVIRKGDSISQIAKMFDVSVNTILWANDMKKGAPLKEGEVLIILPVSGVKHVVTKGQTLKSIAQKYKVDVLDIVDFNDLTVNAKLAVGDELIIPDGEISVDGPVNTGTKTKNYYPKTPVKNIAGYYINPVPGAIKTQGLHGKNAVDLAAPIGTPIYAAAGGTILLARMGWNGAYGNMVIIQHPNGTKTLYSHLFKLASTTGQTVSQGEIIGYVGNSGRVRAAKGGNGAHLHFEVYGAKNPGSNGSWAR